MKNLKDIFLDRVQKTDSCWIWTLGKTTNGYGLVTIFREKMYAHRLSYELFKHSIPEGMHILHSCNNPACVNPDHLRTGSHSENMADLSISGRNSRLTQEQVNEIRSTPAVRGAGLALARKFNVSPQVISNVRRGWSWKHS